MIRKTFLTLLFLTGLVLAIKPEAAKNDSVTIYWSPPDEPYPKTEAAYRLYCKPFAEKDSPSPWLFLASAADTEVIVKNRQTGPGSFIFGVTYLADGVESSMHTSLDSTAIPPEGWYLFWGDKPTWIAYQVKPQKSPRPRDWAEFNLKGQRNMVGGRLARTVYVRGKKSPGPRRTILLLKTAD